MKRNVMEPMSDASLLTLWDEVRGKTLGLVQVPQQDARWTPEGTHNSILWHAGHIFCVVERLVMVGVRGEVHMPPEIPNYGRKGTGVLLKPGDTIAIEPMATLGSEKIITEDDGWTISTADGSLAAHFEHTVLVTENGVEILTTL